MADEPRYSDEIRIPISFTLPWSGRFTSNGHPWPIDANGREWPSDNRGDPEFPIDLLPKGFAPGTSSVYDEGDGQRITDRFAAMDAAMFDEGRRAGERARRARGAGLASQMPIQLVADDGEKEQEELKREEKQLLPHLPLRSGVTGPLNETTPAWDAFRFPLAHIGGATILPEDRIALEVLKHPHPPTLTAHGSETLSVAPGTKPSAIPDPRLGEEGSPAPAHSPVLQTGRSGWSGLEVQLAEHQQKLKQYLENPDAADNKAFLSNVSPAVRQSIINGRVRNLERQIANFQNQIARLKGQ